MGIRGVIAAFLVLAWDLAVGAGELSGYVAVEGRYFFEEPLDPRQFHDDVSLAMELQYHVKWDDGNQGFTFKPFARWDRHDDKRTHFDIREL